jgi:sigma-E factor negative regulatory protein RseC
MLTERGMVTSLNGDFAIVSLQRSNTCHACSARNACGTSAIGKFLGQKHNSVTIQNSIGAQPGDQVSITIPEEGLLKSALLVYILPLLAMMVGAMVSDAWFDSEFASSLGGLSGLLAGFMVVSRTARNLGDSPTIVAAIRAVRGEYASVQFDD